jgi:hypothetical protein
MVQTPSRVFIKPNRGTYSLNIGIVACSDRRKSDLAPNHRLQQTGADEARTIKVASSLPRLLSQIVLRLRFDHSVVRAAEIKRFSELRRADPSLTVKRYLALDR